MKDKLKEFIASHGEWWKFIKFCITASSTAILELVVFMLLQYVVFKSMNEVPVQNSPVLEFLKIDYKGYMYSYFISAIVGYTASFIINRKVTFQADANPLVSMILYIIMVILTIIFSTWFGAFLGTFAKNHGWDNVLVEMICKIIVMTVPLIWLYPLNRFVIHRKKKEV